MTFDHLQFSRVSSGAVWQHLPASYLCYCLMARWLRLLKRKETLYSQSVPTNECYQWQEHGNADAVYADGATAAAIWWRYCFCCCDMLLLYYCSCDMLLLILLLLRYRPKFGDVCMKRVRLFAAILASFCNVRALRRYIMRGKDDRRCVLNSSSWRAYTSYFF